MSNDVPRMPNPVENNSFIPTLDRQGAIWLYIDEITQAYLDFASQTKGTLLEIAAGYGTYRHQGAGSRRHEGVRQ